MHELRIPDRELQSLIGDALRARLRAAGFKTVHADGQQPLGYSFPITLNLAGDVELKRDDDAGVWVFTQVADPMVVDRTEDALRAHVGAVATTAAALTTED